MGLAILFFYFFLSFFGFLEIFLVLNQKYQKPRENKKKLQDPNSPAYSTWVLQLLFFYFFLFFRGNFGFWPKVWKIPKSQN